MRFSLRLAYTPKISIPEGAIKSRELESAWRSASISIPEGAIKRDRALRIEKAVAAFQYPKVRLKVDLVCIQSRTILISIPEGAIKSLLAALVIRS